MLAAQAVGALTGWLEDHGLDDGWDLARQALEFRASIEDRERVEDDLRGHIAEHLEAGMMTTLRVAPKS